MTRFKVYLKKRKLFGQEVFHVVYGKGYSISSHTSGIERMVIYNDDNRHVFTIDWNTVECVYLDEDLLTEPKSN